jgi:hypothetical protein
MYGVAGDKATDLDQIGRFLFNFGDPTYSNLFVIIRVTLDTDQILHIHRSSGRRVVWDKSIPVYDVEH